MNLLTKSIEYQRVVSVLKDPRGHPQEAAILYAIFVIFVLLVLVSLRLLLIKDKGLESNEAEEIGGASPNSRRKKHSLAIFLECFGVALVIFLTIFEIGTYLPSYCRSCHQMQDSYKSWQASSHQSVRCISCHENPGILGAIEGKLANTRMIVAYSKDSQTKIGQAIVLSDACLDCHSALADTTTSGRIKTRHKEIIEARHLCEDCHFRAGHSKGINLQKTTKNTCLGCHDDDKATSDCKLCHPQKGFALEGKNKSEYPRTWISRRNCDGCHPVDKCTACHKIYMPHPEDFNSGKQHARLGFTQKDMCFEQCHKPVDCLICHKQVGTHGPQWVVKHRDGDPVTCNNLCHHENYVAHTKDVAPSEYFCDNCHATRPQRKPSVQEAPPEQEL